jgi:hypothetical protein
MKKIFLTCLAVVFVVGCTPIMLNAKKADGYQGVITNLLIFVPDPADLKSTRTTSSGLGSSRPTNSLTKAVVDLQTSLKQRLPQYLTDKGLPAKLSNVTQIEARQLNAPQSSHWLSIVPVSSSSSCYGGSCQAKVRVEANLRDLSSDAVVWTGVIDVPEASAFNRIDAGSVDRVGSLLMDTFRTQKLLDGVR